MTQMKPVPITTLKSPAAKKGSTPICHVCRKPIYDDMDSTCRVCTKPVHIAWEQGAPESACSKVVAMVQCCGISFVCNPCSERDRQFGEQG
ncbi:MAG: hypothetical protein FJ039_01150 [Chloroflexi bacterium]|nr:hypothetical protein [Chloroflexota bacterium]